MKFPHLALLVALVAVTPALAFAADVTAATVTRVPVVFSEGHDTDPRDRGRPVVLVAGALGVTPEVFREAFSGVHPAGPGSGGPTGEEARANKAALMAVLGKYGITNDQIDAASNRYRYVRSRGEMWPIKPAVANALVQNGVVTGFEIVSGGSGYTTPPTITVPNVKAVTAKVELAFGKDLEKNGSVSAITIAPVGGK
jgi:hypothetical protein